MTKKRHFLLAIVLMIGVFSYAQVLIKAPQSQFSMAKQRAGLITQNRRATITPTDNQVWWGYFSESDVAGLSSIGTGAQEDFEGAIFIPANHPVVGNGTIKAIRIWFNEQLAGVKGMKVWITQSLGNNASGADMVQDVSVSSLIEGPISPHLYLASRSLAINLQFSSSSWDIRLRRRRAVMAL